MGLIKTIKIGAWGVKTALKGAWNAVAHPVDSYDTVTDMRRLLKNFEKIPGLDEQAADAKFLNKTLAVLQMGRVALCLTHDGDDRTDADIVHIDPITADTLASTVNPAHFSISVISRGEGSQEPDISLIVNTENLSRNPDRISSDILAEALTLPIKRIPVVGGLGAKIVAWPVRKIADFIFGIVMAQGRDVAVTPHGPDTKSPEPQ